MVPAVDGQQRVRLLSVLCMISVIKGADLALLPASFRAMEVDLGFKPYALGVLSLCQGVACAVAGPFWGNLVDSGIPRQTLLAAGTGSWGCCTFALAFASSFSTMAILRILNGSCLAMLLPVVQSWVADLCPKAERGMMFGWLGFFSNLGQIIACLFVTPLSNQRILGMDGWRAALTVVGVLSWFTMGLIWYLVDDEPRGWKPERFGATRELRLIYRFMKVPTFAVIILQGIFGTIPGAALAFTTMYFQYIGLSDTLCALINAFRIIGDGCGGLVGGAIGDMLNSYSPKYGRAVTAQISILSGLPCLYAIFMAIPREDSMLVCYAGLFFLHGLVVSWAAPGCICPIMCDIVPRRHLASAYAWELAAVFCSGNTVGPVLVGFMSQSIFGYRLSTEQVVDMSDASREQNAQALGKALFFSSAMPYAASAVLFTLLYYTYPHDMQASTESDGSDIADDPEPNEWSRIVGKRTDSRSAS